MKEKTARKNIVAAIATYRHAMAVENPAHPGTPDINFAGGWIEVKSRDEWPARATTPVRPRHPLMMEQIRWIRTRVGTGRDKVYIAFVVGKQYMFFDGLKGIEIIGLANRKDLEAAALLSCTRPALESNLRQLLG